MLVSVLALLFYAAGFYVKDGAFTYQNNTSTNHTASLASSVDRTRESFVVRHLATPKPLKAVYMTSWVAGTPLLRDKVIKLIEETEINAVVIDIKDATGKISFLTENYYLRQVGSGENRIPEIKRFLGRLHDKNIYVIGRISVFQDPYLANKRPDLAVKKANGIDVWKDRKGISWLDAASMEVWEYTIAIGKEAYGVGFDELNFDYVRFPSDGDMMDISYAMFDGENITKAEQIKNFFEYLTTRLRQETAAVLSADLFGMTTTNPDDLNIGQILENAAPYFDFIDPMVYPSHYPSGFRGFNNPAEKPYEVVRFSMDEAVKKLVAASSTPSILRPWLQDFNLGANYDASMVRAQIQATYDAGLDSWLIWSPSNRYTAGAFLKE